MSLQLVPLRVDALVPVKLLQKRVRVYFVFYGSGEDVLLTDMYDVP